MRIEPNLGEAAALLPTQPTKEMISVSPLPDGRTKVRVNSSSIGIIQECLRKAKYSLDEHWRADVEGPGTLFGSAIHRAMEIYYSGKLEERLLPRWEDCEPLGFGHLPQNPGLIQRAMLGFIEKAQPLSGLPDGDKRSIPNGVWTLYEYFKAYINDPYVTYSDAQGPFIERTFSMTVWDQHDLVVEVFGTIDFIFISTADGSILPGDHKTASSLGFGGSSYYDRDKPNHQYTLYSWAARDVFGVPSGEFLVNVIEVKAKPKTARGAGPSFPRQVTRRDQDDYDELKEVIMKTVWDYLGAKNSGVWPLGPIGACSSYGACQFKAVCSAPKSLRPNILSAKFKRS